ncbi:hypothetical protein NA57DRAFT_61679 [Rhizodiscina lignyota]|uniref:Uncharacterized protein n=1 Tax=Rhizodiscina lignyota TaxID=1504668 RepID=A0A9P4I1B3_9PEZI|nr:hypothetical protein NA57DRAFT_61679 [Rhizodiscina lignyota]
MPVQRTIFGRPVVLHMPPRRFQILFAFIIFLLTTIILFSGPENVKEKVEEATEKILEGIPASIHNPFAASSHKPPVQDNSTSGESSWFSDWKWRHPFSSSVTFDENRSVLPPLKNRPYVYTYYESKNKKDNAALDAEEKLLLIWRRAWWAQGFRPVVLVPADAMNNPLYEKLQILKTQEFPDALEYDISRWLAWGHMGTGVLANWLALPMAPYDDKLLSFLRRGEYPGVIRYDGLQNSLFCGESGAINDLLTSTLDKSNDLIAAMSVIDAADKSKYTSDPQHDAIALYDLKSIRANYKAVDETLTREGGQAEGLVMLGALINAHLHIVWQNTFSAGIAVVKALRHMTTVLEPAMHIAKSLQKCSPSPVANSCPPNRKCQPCEAHEIEIRELSTYKNQSNLFVISAVPHPYTAATLDNWKPSIDIPFIRRESARDPWLFAVTKELLGPAVSSQSRIVHFKDAVAGEHGASHSLWLTAERETHKDLNWIFGFDLPALPEPPPTNTTAAEDEASTESADVPLLDEEIRPGEPKEREIKQERQMLKAARAALRSRSGKMMRLKGAVEMWNLADTEAWKFTRAFSARRRVERLRWEEEEKKFAGAEKGRGAKWW